MRLLEILLRRAILFALLFCAVAVPVVMRGAEIDAARKEFISGHYSNCIKLCEAALAENEYPEEWRLLLVNSLVATGKYREAGMALSNALQRYSWSLGLRVLGHDVFPYAGQTNRATEMLQEIEGLVTGRSDYRYRDPQNLVALGKAALLLSADPRRVLDNIFSAAKKLDPTYRETYLAIGQLALDKHDFSLAAKSFQEGLKRFPDDPDLNFGLAEAFAPSDRKQMLKALDVALEQNTNHVSSMLLVADHLIDAEEYDAAKKMVERALAVNPWRPETWAYRAVLNHLQNDAEGEKTARETALKFWRTNPRVDFLIGQNLSQKYRFLEGAAYQRRALTFNTNYIPAKAQLAQDLLRLGDEAEGWKLAEEAREQDEYDATTYNLVTLKDTLAKFRTITNEDFIVRMATNETAIYGDKVLALLSRAKSNLTAKYGVRLARPTTVEIFPEQKDFGVRTFGMPDNPGFLGVCFGPVITANSPASQAAHPANWEAVLWHEFTHVITLQMTRNKMPRWLSEGISVHEELAANPTWGQRMTARYREMTLGDDLTPVSDLSSAFLAPKTPHHLQFAYYESALVVEYLVKEFGIEALKKILQDLGEGVEINQAIAKHTAPMEKIEKDFTAFARTRAEQLAPALEWTKPEPRELRSTNWLAAHPTNFWGLQRRAQQLISERKWEEAKVPLRKLIDGYPNQSGEDSAYLLLAQVHHALNETNAEREVLMKLASIDADVLDAFSRLMDLGAQSGDWTNVFENAQRHLAVNPLIPQPHRLFARSCEELGKSKEAIASYRVLLLLDPPDPAEVHYRLARLLHKENDPTAKRHVLQALEEAPRYRDAQKLLLEIQRSAKERGNPVSASSGATGGQDVRASIEPAKNSAAVSVVR